jgi:hypothetical protein
MQPIDEADMDGNQRFLQALRAAAKQECECEVHRRHRRAAAISDEFGKHGLLVDDFRAYRTADDQLRCAVISRREEFGYRSDYFGEHRNPVS